MSAVPKRGNLQDKVEFAGHASNVVTENWIPPIQKHTREGVVQFVTIRVRIFASDSENDFNAKLNGSELYPEDVCKVIADRQGLSESARKSFALWVIGRDIELQLRPRQDVFALMEHWHRWVEKYTHFPEAKNAAHPICRHWFVYRREALVYKAEKLEEEAPMINLLYGEARQNVLTSRYPSTTEDVINLAGLALQSQGDYDTLRHPVGYLSSSDRWHYYVPILLRKSLRVNVWEERILEAYSRNKGKSPILARTRYLEYVRKWAFYGNSFFPCCEFLPPGGYFEMRTQHLLFGVGADGVVLIDQEKHKLVFNEKWGSLLWQFGNDSIRIWYTKNGKQKTLDVFTPQSGIIENIIERALHIAGKRGALPAAFTAKNNKIVAGLGKLAQKASEVSMSGGATRFDQARQKRQENAMQFKTVDVVKQGGVAEIEDAEDV